MVVRPLGSSPETGSQVKGALRLIEECEATPVGTTPIIDDVKDAGVRRSPCLRGLLRSDELEMVAHGAPQPPTLALPRRHRWIVVLTLYVLVIVVVVVILVMQR